MKDRLNNQAYQADISVLNTISILASKNLNQFGLQGTAHMKPSWLSLFAFMVDVHYYYANKTSLFYGSFAVCSHTIAVSFKPLDDAFLTQKQIADNDGILIIPKDYIGEDGEYTYSRLADDMPEYIFIESAIENIIQKIYSNNGVPLWDELAGMGFVDLVDKYDYPTVKHLNNSDYNFLINKYFKQNEKAVHSKKKISIKKTDNVINFDRNK